MSAGGSWGPAGGPSGSPFGPPPNAPKTPWNATRFASRGSVIGPLILILIGCAFLVTNLLPNLPIWQLAADYWPFLLVGWGMIRVIEILYTHGQGQPLPRYGISGGEWSLVLFLVFFGSVLFAGHRVGERFSNTNLQFRGLQIFGEGFDFPVTAKITGVGAAPKLMIDDYNGDMRVVVGAADTIEAKGRTTVRAMNDGEARRLHDDSPLELTQEGGRVVLRLRRASNMGFNRQKTDFDVTVPAGTSIEAHSHTGDFDITGITGDVNINADNAGVRLNNIGGRVIVETRRSDVVHLNSVKGDVELRGAGEDIELENISGEVKIAGSYRGDLNFRALSKPIHVENRGVELRLDSLEGSVRMDRGTFSVEGVKNSLNFRGGSTDAKINGVGGPVEVEVSRGDIQVAPSANAAGTWKLRTGAGDIELSLAPGFDIQARTGRGEINSDFSEIRSESSHGNAEVHGHVGTSKGLSFDASSGRGNIRINKGSPASGGSSNAKGLVRSNE